LAARVNSSGAKIIVSSAFSENTDTPINYKNILDDAYQYIENPDIKNLVFLNGPKNEIAWNRARDVDLN
jgi:hypothetical protein